MRSRSRAVPRERGAGDGDKNVEWLTRPLLTIQSAGNGDPERAPNAMALRTICWWKREPSDAGSRPISRKSYPLLASVWIASSLRLFDFRDDLYGVRSGLGRPAPHRPPRPILDHRLGSSSLFGTDLRRCLLLVIEMDHGRRDMPRTREQTNQSGSKLPARACIHRYEQTLDTGRERRRTVPGHCGAFLDRIRNVLT